MSSKWLRCVYQRRSAELRLICFPWAGGGAAFYANWGKKFASEIEGLMQFCINIVVNSRILKAFDLQRYHLNALTASL